MSVGSFEELVTHKGLKIECVTYGKKEVVNAAIECEDCNEVLLSFDKYPEED